jgi:hypothetical protein
MRLAAGIALRLFASVLLAYAAVRMAQHGGPWITLAIFLSVAAVGTFGMTLMSVGGAVLAWRRGELREHS